MINLAIISGRLLNKRFSKIGFSTRCFFTIESDSDIVSGMMEVAPERFQNIQNNSFVEIKGKTIQKFGSQFILAKTVEQVAASALDSIENTKAIMSEEVERYKIACNFNAAVAYVNQNYKKCEDILQVGNNVLKSVVKLTYGKNSEAVQTALSVFLDPTEFQNYMCRLFPVVDDSGKRTSSIINNYDKYVASSLNNASKNRIKILSIKKYIENGDYTNASVREFNSNDRGYDAAIAESTLMSEEDLDSVRI